MNDKVLQSLKKVLGEAFDKDIAEEVSQHIDEITNEKSEEKIKELKNEIKKKEEELKKKEEELKKKEEEIDSLKEKLAQEEKIFKEEAEEFAYEMAEEFAKKENILFEEVENFKKEAIQAIEESALEYKNNIEKIVEEVAVEYRSHLENIMLEEAKNFRIKQEADLAKDVEQFRKDLIEKIDQYLEAEIPKHIPEGLVESAAKAKAYEGLVTGILETFSRNYIKIDSSGYEALKQAKKDVENLSEQYNAKAKEAVALTAKVRELERKNKIAELTEGLTRIQKEKVKKLLENVSTSELESKFKSIVELIVEDNAREIHRKNTCNPSTIIQESKSFNSKLPHTTNAKNVEKQLESIEDSQPKYVINEQIDQWKKTLDRLNKRI